MIAFHKPAPHMLFPTSKKSTLAVLLFAFFIFAGCKKDITATKVSYDFSYTGSQYLGGSLHFTTTAPASAQLLWSFGDSTTSVGAAPNHSYTGTGKFIVSLMINGDSATTISKTIYIGNDSIHQALIAGTWNWHRQTAGFYPPTQKDSVWHYTDTSFALYSIPGAVVFLTDTLFYSSASGTTITFSDYPANPYIDNYVKSSLQFNYSTNQIVYNYTYHVSADAGEWTDTYTSF
jgi:hypothetical protein